MRSNDSLQLGFVGTYPPSRCGIGTFTHDIFLSFPAVGTNEAFLIAGRPAIVRVRGGSRRSNAPTQATDRPLAELTTAS